MRLGIAGAGMIVRGLFSFIHEIEGIELNKRKEYGITALNIFYYED